MKNEGKPRTKHVNDLDKIYHIILRDVLDTLCRPLTVYSLEISDSLTVVFNIIFQHEIKFSAWHMKFHTK